MIEREAIEVSPKDKVKFIISPNMVVLEKDGKEYVYFKEKPSNEEMQ